MIFNLIATSRYDAWYTKSKSQSHEGLFFLELCGDFTEFFSIPETEITYYMIY